jgi:hypothetical protein
MNSNYTSMAALIFREAGIFTVYADQQSKPLSIHEYYIPSVLEMFISANSVGNAYQAYRSFRQSKSIIDISVLSSVQGTFGKRPGQIALLMINNKVLICPIEALFNAYQLATIESDLNGNRQKLIVEMMGRHQILDLTAQSLATHLVVSTLRACYLPAKMDYPDLTLEQFTAVVRSMFINGLLTVPVGAIDFGNFKRLIPFCPDYGYSRGTPIDRYYLNRFIEEIRDEVTGNTLEIGGAKQNQQLYGFSRANPYRALDMKAKTGVDIVGDVHNPDLCRNNSLDSIIIFNVLEHCERPWVVVDNIHNWLKERGKVFCMVPTAQRIHGAPNDFWRILPDAMGTLFSKFSALKLLSYGNPITTISSLMGIAAEELSREDLESLNNEYPVATCVVAQKA